MYKRQLVLKVRLVQVDLQELKEHKVLLDPQVLKVMQIVQIQDLVDLDLHLLVTYF